MSYPPGFTARYGYNSLGYASLLLDDVTTQRRRRFPSAFNSYPIAIRLALPPAAAVLIEVETSSRSQ